VSKEFFSAKVPASESSATDVLPDVADSAIRPLRDEREAEFCADFLVTSEPWVTLGLTFDMAMQRLTDSNREVYVVMVSEQIVGVLILSLEGTFKGYIQTIGVHPDWRCRGIGTKMIKWAEQRIFRQSPNVFLCVSSFNLHAQNLYDRLGYRRVGELTDFVVKGHSEFLMRKSRGPLRNYTPPVH
jgi:ribosomal protein S18 acetylase RimI-like enzyme